MKTRKAVARPAVRMGRSRSRKQGAARRRLARDPEDTLTPQEEKILAHGLRQIKRGQYVTLDQLKDELGL